MTVAVEVPCWRVYGWGRGRWTLRGVYSTAAEAGDYAEFFHHRNRIRTKVEQSTRRVLQADEAPPPGPSQRFREQQAAKQAVRRQALTYYKSGSNGTEIPQLPSEEAVQ